jgi:hypothetical protein
MTCRHAPPVVTPATPRPVHEAPTNPNMAAPSFEKDPPR